MRHIDALQSLSFGWIEALERDMLVAEERRSASVGCLTECEEYHAEPVDDPRGRRRDAHPFLPAHPAPSFCPVMGNIGRAGRAEQGSIQGATPSPPTPGPSSGQLNSPSFPTGNCPAGCRAGFIDLTPLNRGDPERMGGIPCKESFRYARCSPIPSPGKTFRRLHHR